MQKLFEKVSAILVVWTVAVGSAHAGDLRSIALQADAVVVGSRETRFETADKVTFNLSVDRVLKGEQIPSLMLWVLGGPVLPHDQDESAATRVRLCYAS